MEGHGRPGDGGGAHVQWFLSGSTGSQPVHIQLHVVLRSRHLHLLSSRPSNRMTGKGEKQYGKDCGPGKSIRCLKLKSRNSKNPSLFVSLHGKCPVRGRSWWVKQIHSTSGPLVFLDPRFKGLVNQLILGWCAFPQKQEQLDDQKTPFK